LRFERIPTALSHFYDENLNDAKPANIPHRSVQRLHVSRRPLSMAEIWRIGRELFDGGSRRRIYVVIEEDFEVGAKINHHAHRFYVTRSPESILDGGEVKAFDEGAFICSFFVRPTPQQWFGFETPNDSFQTFQMNDADVPVKQRRRNDMPLP
jgi:hypothetical protein